MKRKALSKFLDWKNNPARKPLIVRGARQVGKTWLIMDFAQKEFNGNYIYLNFEENPNLRNVFDADFNPQRIKQAISLAAGGKSINSATLLIFDEIQAAPRGITSLKYFCENDRQQPVIAAGSLLGVAMHDGDSFPVGKVDFIDLFPLDFNEFLVAMGKEQYVRLMEHREWDMVKIVEPELRQLLKTYYYVGGMPEVVDTFIRTHDYAQARQLQQSLLLTYQNDFSKHAPASEVPRINQVWASVPGQLAKENKKFIYGMVRQGARAKDFELAIEWLMSTGLLYKVTRAKSGELPLNAFEDMATFKVFLPDVGLLSAMSKLDASVLVEGNTLFSTYKGALTEQYVFQQLHDKVDFLYYWSAENSRGELDFLAQNKGEVIPIEVKAEENLKSKSLKAFVTKYTGLHGVRLSMSPYREQDWMTNVPLYAAGTWFSNAS